MKAWRTLPFSRLEAVGGVVLAASGMSCAEECPDGYRLEQDVCVAAAPEAPHRCEVLPMTKADPRGKGLLARVDILGGDCFWIDSTEVTVEAYQAFIDEAPAEDISWEPTWCTWKTTRSEPINNDADVCTATIPTLDTQPFASKNPIRCVDFCDAEAYCRFAGKRLCYGGGSRGVQGPRGVPKEWLLACTNSLESAYPWGDDPADGDCNVAPVEECRTCIPHLVGDHPSCRSFGGVSDLLGNVSEWTLSCNFILPDQGLSPSGCMVRGGSFDEPLAACATEPVLPADTRRRDVGFRCCADLTPGEALQISE